MRAEEFRIAGLSQGVVGEVNDPFDVGPLKNLTACNARFPQGDSPANAIIFPIVVHIIFPPHVAGFQCYAWVRRGSKVRLKKPRWNHPHRASVLRPR